MYANKLWVFDNIISQDLQENIRLKLMCNEFPWYFIKDITDNEKGKQERPGFEHMYVRNFHVNSDHHRMMLPILDNACEKIGFNYSKIFMGRSFLQLPLGLQDTKRDTPHTDWTEKHLVVLYYVCDSDGDTVIYNEQKLPENKKLTVQKTVTPKQGRAVVFDGSYWHTAEQPKYNTRLIVNYNLV